MTYIPLGPSPQFPIFPPSPIILCTFISAHLPFLSLSHASYSSRPTLPVLTRPIPRHFLALPRNHHAPHTPHPTHTLSRGPPPCKVSADNKPSGTSIRPIRNPRHRRSCRIRANRTTRGTVRSVRRGISCRCMTGEAWDAVEPRSRG